MKKSVHFSYITLILCGLVGILSCSQSNANQPDSTVGPPSLEGGPSVQWGACPKYPEFEGMTAECTFVAVPLNYEKPNRTINIFIARVRGSAPESEKRGQLWFVTGGPGASAIGFVRESQRLALHLPDWDYYVFEQRGVGNSAPLYCVAAADAAIVSPEQAPDCLAELRKNYPEGIGDFTVTNTARDLARVIDQFRIPGRKVAVYGVSYGTYLLQRYLALYGNQPDMVILDSIEAVGREEFDVADRDVNDAVRMIMEHCDRDASCRQRLSGIAAAPWDAMSITLDQIDQGILCSELQALLDEPLTRSDLRHLFAVMAEQVPLRALIPAVVLRLNRCRSDDVMVLEHLINPLFFEAPPPMPVVDPGPGFVPYEQVKSSPVLFSHIALSELWNGTPLAQATIEAKKLKASLGTVVALAELADAHVWPTYKDPLSELHASTQRPVLMLNSDLDFQTPLADAMEILGDLNGPSQWFVTMPDAGHVVIFNSLLSSAQGDNPIDHCGARVMLSFLDEPTRRPDTSCISQVYRLSFDAANQRNRKSSRENFGTEDLWGDAAGQ